METFGVMYGALNSAQGTGQKFDNHAAVLRGIKRKPYTAADGLPVAETRIVILVSKQYSRAISHCPCSPVGFLNQHSTYPATLAGRMDC